MKHASFCHIGPRETNQDRILLPTKRDDGAIIAGIADGIGGAPGGGEAAQIAVDVAGRYSGSLDLLSSIFGSVAEELERVAAADPKLARMGTTLSIVAINGRSARVAHVGDTRIYHIRGAGLNHLTRDQTEVAELVRKGVLSENQARRYHRRNVLLSALTASSEFEVYEAEAFIQSGDRLLLVSDGVYQAVKRGAILNSSLAHADLATFVTDIERRVELAGPKDNFSALALEIA
ncbi:protein phosphatase 2C domain-containing protein [uncultured Sphingomonas sp.]|uniref:PP2C family protein-serine/threonine phosphatase n=1 Tax=uncultured Sphingomonas sp. TaxID=158754 RepID=UPI0025DCC400|nr:protein phosphatase 2C domain-containing protein [uncultured Sphingomonas sp.]